MRSNRIRGIFFLKEVNFNLFFKRIVFFIIFNVISLSMKLIIKLFLIFLGVIFFTHSSFATEQVEIKELSKIFTKYNANGSILIYNSNNNSYAGYNLQRCAKGFLPASTFKIPNSLIALEIGAANAHTLFKWNGEELYLKSWQKDMYLKEAFKLSNVSIYQKIATDIGLEKMKHYISLFQYGNMDINKKNLDTFWLEGNSKITQYEQIYFLKKMYNYKLPISNKTVDTVKDFMLNEVGQEYKIYAKTGLSVTKNKPNGWYVGFVETKGNVFYFTLNIKQNSRDNLDNFLLIRKDITMDVLKQLGII